MPLLGHRPRVVRHELHLVLLGRGLHPREVRDERRLVGGAVVGQRPHVLEEPFETAGHRPGQTRRLLHPVRVRGPGRHVGEVAGGEQLGGLGALGVFEEQPDLALQDVEGLVGPAVHVGRDQLAGRARGRDHAELPVRLVAGQQHGEHVGEQHRVLALAAAQDVGRGPARKQPLPLRALLGVDQVLETHRRPSGVITSSCGGRRDGHGYRAGTGGSRDRPV